MVRYSTAVVFLYISSILYGTECFQKTAIPGRVDYASTLKTQRIFGGAIRASVYSNYDSNNRIGDEIKEKIWKLTFSSPFDDFEDDDFEVPYSQARDLDRLSSNSYTVDMPLSTTAEAPIGMSIRQVGKGTLISDLELNLDSLTLKETVQPASRSVGDDEVEEKVQILDEAALINLFENNFGPNFEGVIVSEVYENGLAWEAGIRAGDVLVATSATMGDKIWPKNTLEGVRSAFTSRKVMSPTITLQFTKARANLDAAEVAESFELSLTRPMGIEIEGELISFLFFFECVIGPTEYILTFPCISHIYRKEWVRCNNRVYR